MKRIKLDEERESRIRDEAVVDAHDAEEQALGWHYYLEGRLEIPFEAVCDQKRPISPIKKGELVTVLRML